MKMGQMTVCSWVCVVLGIIAGLLVMFTVDVAETWFPTFLISVAVGCFVGLALNHLVCGGMHSHHEGEAAHHAADSGSVLANEAVQEAKGGARDAGAKGADVSVAEAAAQDARLDEAIAEEAEARAREEAAAKEDAALKARAAAAEKERAAAEKALEDARAERADAEAAPDYDKDGVLEGENEGARPEALSKPRGGKGDNLKQIKGVGPKLEAMLNGMGFWHFDQIAAWSGDEVAWVDANLKGFKGRVSRDSWVEQAKALASGEETEFSKRVGQGKVY
ncbi:hypothetical protein U5922_007330 [Aquicoccus sp. G2-2]|uniref:hypothetical protein n=1 Tax=Aquicoccus sp. G2-2 TaxID=3092120 RepID=UPI002AE002F2|nr:hypothetical protein [Aquicoccus sp. G2-2]MEA1113297.1 hypothetical protein [Aquicoccus sp. G2-2]